MAEVVACGDLRGHESQPEMEERMAREAGGWFLCREGAGQGPLSLESFDSCVPSSPPSHLAAWTRCRPCGSLAGLHAQLLPVGRLLHLRLGAGVGASVERRHGAAFGIGVQAAV